MLLLPEGQKAKLQKNLPKSNSRPEIRENWIQNYFHSSCFTMFSQLFFQFPFFLAAVVHYFDLLT
jgi:hypothetical protein